MTGWSECGRNHRFDETLYEVECLTLDELAERINDDCFAYTEDYVRFIDMGHLQPGME